MSLSLADTKSLARQIRENLDLGALVLATYATLVISNNTERPLGYAWPAVAAAGAGALRSLQTRAAIPFNRLAMMCIGAQMVHFGLTLWNDLAGSSLYQPANPAVALLIFALWLIWSRQFARL